MLLLTLAIAPGLAVCLYFFYSDVYNREPGLNIIMSFIWGMLSTVPAIVLEMAASEFRYESIIGVVLSTFFFVALIEEACKFFVLRFYSYTRKSFDEPLDGIVYSVMVSMGFATLENIGYIILDHDNGYYTGLMRMFTSVPAHATFAVIMGYYVGKAKFDLLRREQLLFKGLFYATLAHGIYDSFLFLNGNKYINRYLSESASAFLLFAGAAFSLFICIHLSRKLIRLHSITSEHLFKSAPVLTIRIASEKDIQLIKDLAQQIWPQTYASMLTPQQIDYMMQMMYSEKSLSGQMKNGHQFILVYNAGIPIGFAAYSETAPTIYKLHKIYILPLQQGRGTGTFVIDQIINDIRPKGATMLRLNVNRNNKAKDFYERQGFVTIGTEDIDIGGGFYMNDYVMEKKIN